MQIDGQHPSTGTLVEGVRGESICEDGWVDEWVGERIRASE